MTVKPRKWLQETDTTQNGKWYLTCNKGMNKKQNTLHKVTRIKRNGLINITYVVKNFLHTNKMKNIIK